MFKYIKRTSRRTCYQSITRNRFIKYSKSWSFTNSCSVRCL